MRQAQRVDFEKHMVSGYDERQYRSYRWKIRRQREIRKKMIRLAVTICVILMLVISYHSIISHAENDTENVFFKYYTEIEVAYGDSLWTIAQEYADEHYSSKLAYMNELKSINHISGDVIKEGQTLIVPYYSIEYK